MPLLSLPLPFLLSLPLPFLLSLPLPFLLSFPLPFLLSLPLPFLLSLPLPFLLSLPLPFLLFPSYCPFLFPSYCPFLFPSYCSLPTVPSSSLPTVPSSSLPTVPSSSLPTVPSFSLPTVPSSSLPTVPSLSFHLIRIKLRAEMKYQDEKEQIRMTSAARCVLIFLLFTMLCFFFHAKYILQCQSLFCGCGTSCVGSSFKLILQPKWPLPHSHSQEDITCMHDITHSYMCSVPSIVLLSCVANLRCIFYDFKNSFFDLIPFIHYAQFFFFMLNTFCSAKVFCGCGTSCVGSSFKLILQPKWPLPHSHSQEDITCMHDITHSYMCSVPSIVLLSCVANVHCIFYDFKNSLLIYCL